MYLKKHHGDIASYGVVIGHDARYNSAKFAALAANAFIAQRIPVWFYSEALETWGEKTSPVADPKAKPSFTHQG